MIRLDPLSRGDGMDGQGLDCRSSAELRRRRLPSRWSVA